MLMRMLVEVERCGEKLKHSPEVVGDDDSQKNINTRVLDDGLG